MNIIPTLECTGTAKISPKLTIGYLPRNTLQFCTPSGALFVKYVNAPYGLKRSEMSETDSLTAHCYCTQSDHLAYFQRLDTAIDTQCKKQFKRSPEPIVREDILRFKIEPNTPVCNENREELTMNDLKAGQRIVPILKASCLWSGGGSVGVSLKAVRIMVVDQAEEDKPDAPIEFDF